MPGAPDRCHAPGGAATARRVPALIVLLFAAGAALRGYLPAARPATGQRPSAGPVPTLAVAALLAGASAVLVVAVVTRLRDRRAEPGRLPALPAGLGGRGNRPSWRALLTGLAVITVWLAVCWLLGRLAGRHGWARPGRSGVQRSGAPVSATVPGPDSGPPGPAPLHPSATADLVGDLTLAAAAALLVVLGVAAAGARLRRGIAGGTPGRPAPPVAGADPLTRAAERGLAVIGQPGCSPRDAIIGCYLTMERELARTPDAAPQDCDTATEVLARAVAHRALSADHAAELVGLFTEARFSRHPMTERHRREAARILTLVLAELRVRA